MAGKTTAGGKPETQAEPAQGEDNNKRLAWFEQRETATIEALVKAGALQADSVAGVDAVEALFTELRHGESALEAANGELNKLGAFLADSERRAAKEGEGVADVAIRLLQELDQADEALRLAHKQLGEDHDALGAANAELDKLKEFIVPDDRFEPQEGETIAETAIRCLTELAEAGEAGGAGPGAEAQGNSADADTIAALEERVRELTEDLAAARSKADGATKALRKGPKPPKARKAGEIEAPAEALEAAFDGEGELEMVFSNGSTEIVEFDPVFATAANFTKRGESRYALRDAIMLKGAGREHRLRGVALLKDGKQVAWCGFPRPITIPIGQTVQLKNAIMFAPAPKVEAEAKTEG